jgi:hypothetical protein
MIPPAAVNYVYLFACSFLAHLILVLCILLDSVVPTYIAPYVSYLLAVTEIDIMKH